VENKLASLKVPSLTPGRDILTNKWAIVKKSLSAYHASTRP